MMIIQKQKQHPTVEIPAWDTPYDDPTALIFSPQTTSYFSTLQRFLPSREPDLNDPFSDSDDSCDDYSYTSDNFRMYEFKVRKCARGRSHDWTECPFAHPGEKARRRDPRKYHYSGIPCPDFRHGGCPKGDACQYSHGVFECWLHPSRYRTQPCKDGVRCGRRVCFFAHTPGQLRVLTTPTESPLGFDSVGQLVKSVRGLNIGYGSPKSPTGYMGGLYGGGLRPSQEEEDVPMERVESGKDVRARMYAKLSQENSFDQDRVDSATPGPDLGWISELVN